MEPFFIVDFVIAAVLFGLLLLAWRSLLKARALGSLTGLAKVLLAITSLSTGVFVVSLLLVTGERALITLSTFSKIAAPNWYACLTTFLISLFKAREKPFGWILVLSALLVFVWLAFASMH
jgi:hypothetical protein